MQDGNSPDASVVVAEPRIETEDRNNLSLVEVGKGTPLEGNVFYAKKVDVLGDLHGNWKVDLNKDEDRLKVLVGDVPDRGPESWQRVEEVMELVEKGKALYILGNHEALFMGAMVEDTTGNHRDRLCLYNWLYNGGYMTAVGAGVDLTAIDNLINTRTNSSEFQKRRAELTEEYKSQGIAPTDAEKYADLQARQEALIDYIDEVISSKPQQGEPNYDSKLNQYQQKKEEINAILDITLGEVRNNANLQRWNKLLIDHGLMYVAVDDSFNTHAAILPDKQYGQYGVGLEAFDNLQSKINQGDPEAIYFLALDDDSPLWTREEYLHIIADPNQASELRAKLNEQAAKPTATRPAFKVELINSGHTPVDRPEVGKSAGKTISLKRPTDQKFVLLDYHVQESGKQAAMRMDLDPATGKVSARLINAVDGSDLPAKDGSKVEAEWQVEGKIVEESEENGRNDVNKTEEELNDLTREIAAAMEDELIKAFSRENLILLGKGGSVSLAIGEYGKNLISEAEAAGQEGRPALTEAQKLAKIALGYDLQIGALQLEQRQLVEAMEGASSEKHKELVERNEEIIQEIERLEKEKREKVKITGNSLAEFAQIFGASAEEAQEAPLVVVSNKIEEAISDPEKRKILINSLRESEYFTEEQINSFEKFLKSKHLQKVVKEQGKKAAKVVGGIGLFMLLMAYLASKQEKGGGG